MILPLDLLLDYWTEQLLFDAKFVFWTRILYMKVQDLATVWMLFGAMD